MTCSPPASLRDSVSKTTSVARLAAARLLNQERPFVYDRRFTSAKFVAQQLETARRLLSPTVAVGAAGAAVAGREHDASDDAAAGALPEPTEHLAAESVIGSGWRFRPLLSPAEERACFLAMNALRAQANPLRSRLNPRRPARGVLRQLEQIVQEADAIRQYIVEANVRLVISVATKFADALLTLDDLCSEGLVILLKAIDGFDAGRGFRFSTYATNSLQRHFCRLRKRTYRKRQFGAGVPDELLAAVAGAADVALTPDDPRQLVRSLFRACRRCLDPRERRILDLRFGLRSGEEHTLRQVAALLRISKERVRQVLTRAVGKLQAAALEQRLEWTPRELTPQPRLTV